MLEREQFDLLHFHEPFVPFLSPIILRLSTSVNVATFHAYGGFSPSYEFGRRVMGGYAERLHGRIAVSGAAKHFIDRYFPGDYKVIPNGVDVARFQRAVPIARWQDGTRNLLFVGRHEPRKGLLELLKAYRILRKTGCDCRLLVVGPGPARPRGAALRGDAAARRRRVPRPGQRRGEGPALPDGRRLRLAGDRRRVVRDRPARGDGRRARRSSRPTSTATRASSGAAARHSSSPPREPKAIAAAVARLLRDDELRAEMSASRPARAQEFSWERVTAKVDDFYGVVIRRLAARDALPAGFHAPIPPSPRAVPGSSGPTGAQASDASAASPAAPTPLENESEPEPPEPTPAAPG